MVCGYVHVISLCCKQKTAYEMRISDWSSDVCSSDLNAAARRPGRTHWADEETQTALSALNRRLAGIRMGAGHGSSQMGADLLRHCADRRGARLHRHFVGRGGHCEDSVLDIPDDLPGAAGAGPARRQGDLLATISAGPVRSEEHTSEI